MTKIDVLDSAVKIGLGALIGAISAIVVAIINSKETTQRDRRQRRLDSLEKCATDFEAVSAVFISLYAAYHTYISVLPPLIKDSSEDSAMRAAIELAANRQWEDIKVLMDQPVTDSLHKLHQIDAKLHLIGAVKASKIATEYRVAVTDLQSAIVQIGSTFVVPTKDGIFAKVPTLEKWEAYGDRVTKLRQALYNQLRLDFGSL